jgi:hypothetical protein
MAMSVVYMLLNTGQAAQFSRWKINKMQQTRLAKRYKVVQVARRE